MKKLLKEDSNYALACRKSNREWLGAKIDLIRPRNEKFKKSITYNGPKLWNDLLLFTKENLMPHVFRKHMKRYYLVFCNDSLV